MSARPPPDPRGARIRDLVLALLEGSLVDQAARAASPVVDGNPPPSMRWGMAPVSIPGSSFDPSVETALPPPSRRWGLIPAPNTVPPAAMPPAEGTSDAPPPSRRWGMLPTPAPAAASAEGAGDASPLSRRWGLIPTEGAGDASPPSRRLGLLPSGIPAEGASDASPPSRRWGLIPADSAGDMSPPSRRWGLLPSPPLPDSADAAPLSRRWGSLSNPTSISTSTEGRLNSPLPPSSKRGGGGSTTIKIPQDGDALEQASTALELVSFELRTLRAAFAEANRRLTQCMDVIVALVSFDYDKKAEVYDRSDIFDGMAAGLNMLGEELSATTVSKAYVDNIIESMSDLLIVTDRDARITTVNQAACALVGYSKEELFNRSIEMLFPELSAADLLSSGGVRDQERDCQHKDGGTVRVSFSASVLRDKRSDGQGLVCVARDLTENKRTEEERWRLQSAIQRQSIILEELSTPLIPISDEILVMPLIGTVDERRAAQMVDTLLQGVVSRRTQVAILDITGIRTMDAQGVQGILKAVQAVRLVGAQAVITGIRPEVARLLVAQGYDLSSIQTFGSLQHGIVHAMKRGPTATSSKGR